MDRTWLYAGLLIVGGIGLAKVLRRGPVVRRGEKLLLVGDSLAVGLAPPLSQLAKENGVAFEVAGQVGSTVRQWAQGALNAELKRRLASRPHVVLVSLGTNDEAMTVDAARAELPMLDALIAEIRASGAELGWIGPPAFIAGQAFAPNGFSQAIQRRVGPGGYYHSEEIEIPRGNDRLHPTVRGYAGWAGMIWQWMRCCRG